MPMLFVAAASIRLINISRATSLRARPFLTPSRMTLDASTLRAARFPATVEHAAHLLGTTKPTQPASMNLLNELLQTPDGARGTLVSVLSDARVPHCDEPVDAQFAALVRRVADRDDAVGADLRKLLVTNVVMPHAMVVYYTDQGDTERLKGSQLTARRAVSLLRVVADNHMVKQVASEFVRGLREDEGPFGAFATKWRYAHAQRENAISAIESAIHTL